MKCRAREKLTEQQEEIVRKHVKEEFSKLTSRYNRDAAAQVLHILHFDFGFGMKRLQRFADRLTEMQAYQKNRYELEAADTPWLCEKQLEQDGIDVDSLLGGDGKES